MIHCVDGPEMIFTPESAQWNIIEMSLLRKKDKTSTYITP